MVCRMSIKEKQNVPEEEQEAVHLCGGKIVVNSHRYIMVQLNCSIRWGVVGSFLGFGAVWEPQEMDHFGELSQKIHIPEKRKS